MNYYNLINTITWTLPKHNDTTRTMEAEKMKKVLVNWSTGSQKAKKSMKTRFDKTDINTQHPQSHHGVFHASKLKKYNLRARQNTKPEPRTAGLPGNDYSATIEEEADDHHNIYIETHGPAKDDRWYVHLFLW